MVDFVPKEPVDIILSDFPKYLLILEGTEQRFDLILCSPRISLMQLLLNHGSWRLQVPH